MSFKLNHPWTWAAIASLLVIAVLGWLLIKPSPGAPGQSVVSPSHAAQLGSDRAIPRGTPAPAAEAPTATVPAEGSSTGVPAQPEPAGAESPAPAPVAFDAASAPAEPQITTSTPMPAEDNAMDNQAKSGAPARAELTEQQYNICFLKGTEPPGSGEYNHLFEPGSYHCVNCGQELFKSDTKYDSHSGWPAFWDANPGTVTQTIDRSLGMVRTEVTCSNCGAHLGHVFDDGPPPTGQRYCINSLALKFVPVE